MRRCRSDRRRPARGLPRRATSPPSRPREAALDRIDAHDGAVNAFCLVDADAALAAAKESAGALAGAASRRACSTACPSRSRTSCSPGRLAHAARLAHDRPRQAVGRRRAGRRPAARAQRRDHRQDHHARARLEGRHRLPAHRRHRQPVEPDAHRGRLERRQRGRRRRWAWARSRSAPTAAARSASRPASPAPSRSSRPTGGCRRYPASPYGDARPRRADDPQRRRRRAAARRAVRLRRSRPVGARDRRRRRSAPFGSAVSGTCGPADRGSAPTLGYVDVDPEVAAAFAAAVEVFAALGAHVAEVDPGFADPVEAFETLWFSGAAKSPPSASVAEQRARMDPGLRRDRASRARGTRRSTTSAPPRRARRARHRRMGAFHDALRPAGHADHADPGVRGGGRGAAGWPHRAGRGGRRSPTRST